MRIITGSLLAFTLVVCGAGVGQAQEPLYTEAQMSQINCVFTGILASADEGEQIGALALSARESTYNADVLDEALTPFVEMCVTKHGWTDEQAQDARALGAISAALNSQVAIAGDAGASQDEIAKVMPLADTISDTVPDMLASGSRADDGTRAALAATIRESGLTPSERAMGELAYVLELAARSREVQLTLGGSLFR